MEITCDIVGKPRQQVQHGAAHATHGRRPQYPQPSLPRTRAPRAVTESGPEPFGSGPPPMLRVGPQEGTPTVSPLAGPS